MSSFKRIPQRRDESSDDDFQNGQQGRVQRQADQYRAPYSITKTPPAFRRWEEQNARSKNNNQDDDDESTQIADDDDDETQLAAEESYSSDDEEEESPTSTEIQDDSGVDEESFIDDDETEDADDDASYMDRESPSRSATRQRSGESNGRAAVKKWFSSVGHSSKRSSISPEARNDEEDAWYAPYLEAQRNNNNIPSVPLRNNISRRIDTNNIAADLSPSRRVTFSAQNQSPNPSRPMKNLDNRRQREYHVDPCRAPSSAVFVNSSNFSRQQSSSKKASSPTFGDYDPNASVAPMGFMENAIAQQQYADEPEYEGANKPFEPPVWQGVQEEGSQEQEIRLEEEEVERARQERARERLMQNQRLGYPLLKHPEQTWEGNQCFRESIPLEVEVAALTRIQHELETWVDFPAHPGEHQINLFLPIVSHFFFFPRLLVLSSAFPSKIRKQVLAELIQALKSRKLTITRSGGMTEQKILGKQTDLPLHHIDCGVSTWRTFEDPLLISALEDIYEEFMQFAPQFYKLPFRSYQRRWFKEIFSSFVSAASIRQHANNLLAFSKKFRSHRNYDFLKSTHDMLESIAAWLDCESGSKFETNFVDPVIRNFHRLVFRTKMMPRTAASLEQEERKHQARLLTLEQQKREAQLVAEVKKQRGAPKKQKTELEVVEEARKREKKKQLEQRKIMEAFEKQGNHIADEIKKMADGKEKTARIEELRDLTEEKKAKYPELARARYMLVGKSEIYSNNAKKLQLAQQKRAAMLKEFFKNQKLDERDCNWNNGSVFMVEKLKEMDILKKALENKKKSHMEADEEDEIFRPGAYYDRLYLIPQYYQNFVKNRMELVKRHEPTASIERDFPDPSKKERKLMGMYGGLREEEDGDADMILPFDHNDNDNNTQMFPEADDHLFNQPGSEYHELKEPTAEEKKQKLIDEASEFE